MDLNNNLEMNFNTFLDAEDFINHYFEETPSNTNFKNLDEKFAVIEKEINNNQNINLKKRKLSNETTNSITNSKEDEEIKIIYNKILPLIIELPSKALLFDPHNKINTTKVVYPEYMFNSLNIILQLSGESIIEWPLKRPSLQEVKKQYEIVQQIAPKAEFNICAIRCGKNKTIIKFSEIIERINNASIFLEERMKIWKLEKKDYNIKNEETESIKLKYNEILSLIIKLPSETLIFSRNTKFNTTKFIHTQYVFDLLNIILQLSGEKIIEYKKEGKINAEDVKEQYKQIQLLAPNLKFNIISESTIYKNKTLLQASEIIENVNNALIYLKKMEEIRLSK